MRAPSRRFDYLVFYGLVAFVLLGLAATGVALIVIHGRLVWGLLIIMADIIVSFFVVKEARSAPSPYE